MSNIFNSVKNSDSMKQKVVTNKGAVKMSQIKNNQLTELSMNLVEENLGMPLEELVNKQIVTTNEFKALVKVMLHTQTHTVNAVNQVSENADKVIQTARTLNEVIDKLSKNINKIERTQDNLLSKVQNEVGYYTSKISDHLETERADIKDLVKTTLNKEVKEYNSRLNTIETNNTYYLIGLCILLAIMFFGAIRLYFNTQDIHTINTNINTIKEVEMDNLKYWFDPNNKQLYIDTVEKIQKAQKEAKENGK